MLVLWKATLLSTMFNKTIYKNVETFEGQKTPSVGSLAPVSSQHGLLQSSPDKRHESSADQQAPLLSLQGLVQLFAPVLSTKYFYQI